MAATTCPGAAPTCTSDGSRPAGAASPLLHPAGASGGCDAVPSDIPCRFLSPARHAVPRLRRSVLFTLLLILLGGLLFVWLGGRLGERAAWEARSLEGRAQLELYRQNLHILVERFHALPALLAQDNAAHRLLREPGNPALRQA